MLKERTSTRILFLHPVFQLQYGMLRLTSSWNICENSFDYIFHFNDVMSVVFCRLYRGWRTTAKTSLSSIPIWLPIYRKSNSRSRISRNSILYLWWVFFFFPVLCVSSFGEWVQSKPPRVKICKCRKTVPHFHLHMVRLDMPSLMEKWWFFTFIPYFLQKYFI